MYVVHTIRDTVGVAPSNLKGKAKDSIEAALKQHYEGIIDKELGVIVCIDNVRDIGPGLVAPLEGSAYHEVTFDAVAFVPELNETIEGEVTEITESGAFVRLGPLEGLLHASQVMDEYISFDPKTPALVGKETDRQLKVGDVVRAKIVTASIKGTVADTKIALTMRQPFLGKLEWIDAERRGEKPEKKAPRGPPRKKPKREPR